MTEHTCELEEPEKYHRNMSSSFVANAIYAYIMDNLNYKPRSIIKVIEEKYCETISYTKAWRAKKKVVEINFGMYEASYDNLPCLLATICPRNSGSYYDVMHYPSVKEPNMLVQQHTFFCLQNLYSSFQTLSPINSTFLTEKYKG